MAREKPRYGCRRLQVLLEREGERVNHKRLYRVYLEVGLCLKRKKRKHCVPCGSSRVPLTAANQGVGTGLRPQRGGRRAHDPCAECVRCLHAECLALEVDSGFAGRRVTRVLDEVIARHGRPQAIRCDNGPELTGRHFLAWAWSGRSSYVTSYPAAQCKTVMSRASTESFVRSVYALAGSATSSTPA